MKGHENILVGLKTAIEHDSLGHAYIFEGPDGVGKRETALSFSSMLLCGSEHFPCGECKSCHLFAEGVHPDFQEIYEPEKSISVEDIRNLLKGLVIRPLYSNYKVIVINDADKMTVQAQNALLKSLEEPPSYVIFILTVQSGASLTPTVRSRCQRILFNKMDSQALFQLLTEKYTIREDRLNFIVSYSDGIIGTALNLIETPEIIDLRERAVEIVSEIISLENADLFKIYDFFEKNSDRIDFILRVILLYFRDILIYNMTANIRLLINSDKKDMIIRNARVSTSKLLDCIQAIWDTYRSIELNANFQLAIEVMLMKIGQMKK